MNGKQRQTSFFSVSLTLFFLAIFFAGIPFSVLKAQQAVPISNGVWQGVTPCIGGSVGLYPVQMEITKDRAAYLARTIYMDDRRGIHDTSYKIYPSNNDWDQYTPRLSPAYVYADSNNKNARKIVFIKGKYSTYLWSWTPIFFSAKCQEAIFVQEDNTMFPNLAGHNDFCESVSWWSSSASSTATEIRGMLNRNKIPGYDERLALFWHQFSDRTFERNFNRSFSTFSDDEIERFIYRLRDCTRYSARSQSMITSVGWFFDSSLIAQWRQTFPHFVSMHGGRTYPNYYAFEKTLPRDFLEHRISLLKEARSVRTNKDRISSDLDALYSAPESPALRAMISRFLTKHTRSLMFVEIEYAEEVMELIAARQEMLSASESLASRFRLSEYPKLPPPDQTTKERLVDDALLKPLTEEEIRDLEQNVEQDF